MEIRIKYLREQGLSYREISAITGVSLGKLHYILTPGEKERLKEKLKEKYVPKQRKPKKLVSEESIKLAAKKRMLKHRYGITYEQYLGFFEKQNWECAICRKRLTIGGRSGAHLDHCHKQNIIRGVLCSHCNIGLMKFRDSIEAIKRAAHYVELSGFNKEKLLCKQSKYRKR